VQCCHHVPGRDFEKMFAPTLFSKFLRIFLSIVSQCNMTTIQKDDANAFLHSLVDRKVHVNFSTVICNEAKCQIHMLQVLKDIQQF
jgi:hypothetical protein